MWVSRNILDSDLLLHFGIGFGEGIEQGRFFPSNGSWFIKVCQLENDPVKSDSNEYVCCVAMAMNHLNTCFWEYAKLNQHGLGYLE